MQNYQDSQGGLTDINLTSLIDVALVLVVIFMIMTPMIMQSNIVVSTPKVGKAGAGTPQTELRAEVYLTEAGAIVVNGVAVTPEALADSLRLLLAPSKKKLVIISADELVIHDRVVQVLDAARQAGARELSIVKRKKA